MISGFISPCWGSSGRAKRPRRSSTGPSPMLLRLRPGVVGWRGTLSSKRWKGLHLSNFYLYITIVFGVYYYYCCFCCHYFFSFFWLVLIAATLMLLLLLSGGFWEHFGAGVSICPKWASKEHDRSLLLMTTDFQLIVIATMLKNWLVQPHFSTSLPLSLCDLGF